MKKIGLLSAMTTILITGDGQDPYLENNPSLVVRFVRSVGATAKERRAADFHALCWCRENGIEV